MEQFGNEPTNLPSEEEIDKKMKDLINQAEAVNAEIDETNKKAKEAMDALSLEVSNAEKEVDAAISDLDQADQEAEDGLDKLMIGRAEEIADEEAADEKPDNKNEK